MTQLDMDLDKPKEAQAVVDEILARRFLLDKDKNTYLVGEGGWARNLTDPDAVRSTPPSSRTRTRGSSGDGVRKRQPVAV